MLTKVFLPTAAVVVGTASTIVLAFEGNPALGWILLGATGAGIAFSIANLFVSPGEEKKSVQPFIEAQ